MNWTRNLELASLVRRARQRAFGCKPHEAINCSICRADAESRRQTIRDLYALHKNAMGWKV